MTQKRILRTRNYISQMTASPTQGAPDKRTGNLHLVGKQTSGAEATVASAVITLRAEKLVKHYGSRPVLKGASLRAKVGQAVGLFGPNGAGKTTFFQILAGVTRPDGGAVYLGNTEITGEPIYRRARMGLGYLPQQSSIFRGLSVERNLLAALELSIADPTERHERLDSLLGEFGISHLRGTPAVSLSGGERRRLEIARALASEPSFLLFDEPLAGIDPVTVHEIRKLVSELKNRGVGVLITDHNVREALEMVDYATILYGGEVLATGSPEELVDDEETRRLYLGESFSR